MLCSGCKKAKYCSKECQLKDWKVGMHKLKCETMRNPVKGKSHVFDLFEEWKETNYRILTKIFRSLLFKEADSAGSGFNLCDDHIAVVCVDYTPSEQNPFQINYCQAMEDEFFFLGDKIMLKHLTEKFSKYPDGMPPDDVLVEHLSEILAPVQELYNAHDGHPLHDYIDSKESWVQVHSMLNMLRCQIAGETVKYQEKVGESSQGLLAMVFVKMAPEYGSDIAKALPEIATMSNLVLDTRMVDRSLLITSMNQGLDAQHHVFDVNH